jgi:hypothetical protein
VVRLGVEGDLAVVQPLDDDHLPQRSAAVEQRGVQARDELLELVHRAGLAQRDVTDVVVEVDVVVLDPDRVGELERHRRELAREQPREMEALREHPLHRLVVVALVALRQLEQHQAADVHRGLGGFEVQERCVHAAQVLDHRGSPCRRMSQVWPRTGARILRLPSGAQRAAGSFFWMTWRPSRTAT